jgi:leader peptidase (prepilin peptidase)/N-methyltransferase
MAEALIYVFIFLFGICIGSFLNVCIYRMGREESIVHPASHCPHCQKPLARQDNIPLLSYILLRGKCRFCGKKISFRYFVVELLTGLLFLALYQRFGATTVTLIYCLLAAGLIIATFVDLDFQIIPDEITVGGIVSGIILSFFFPAIHGRLSPLLGLRDALLGVVVGGGVLWILGGIGDFIFKKESMGGGDIKLLAMIGAFLGWKIALLSLPLASLLGAVVGVIIKIRTKKSVIAFGPYLALGALVGLFWSEKIISTFFYF